MACSAKFLLLLLLSISFYINSSLAARNLIQTTNTDFLRTSCAKTTYPKLCYSSLSVHATTFQTSPKLLANTALSVTLSSAKSASEMMLKLAHSQGINLRQAAAMRDCIELLRDSADEIRRSINKMGNTKESDFQLMINDVQTWVSAALTDESTCSDGFAGKAMNGNVKNSVREQVVNIGHLTSNALALINNYASLHEIFLLLVCL
ncbi:hypothetical protein K2173_026590 [Erythroxylum novogranatense]|uniref:Pectinesterase inhibitor domain-containing protein n=1 Tax=Erythroxylum novogranatense TaxID=1862640 RepID=A0AAV8TZ56_9ROSI|nr:hypothetical protein K2173_026590 [Erythroxylum novogranatense]